MDTETDEFYEGQIVIDGETEVDDLLLASKFAELEHFKSQSILTEIESSRGRRALVGKSSDDIDIVPTDEESNSEGNGYESSESEDAEIQELVKKEMVYRNKTAGKHGSRREGLGDKLSDTYLSQFGISLEKGQGTKNVLSDISECEETAESGDEAIKKSRAGLNAGRYVHFEGLEDKLSWLPNIEILDMPEKVDTGLPCEFVGEIYSVINDGAVFGMEGIFIVKSDPSSIILDLGSVLCLEDKTIVGAIIDTFGPIASPFYVLSKQSNVDHDLLKIGTRIYCDRRHSTILGRAGKVKCSYFSKSTNSKLFASKSPFSNKEFKKDPKAKVPVGSTLLSGNHGISEGFELDDGEVIPGDYDEDEDEQEESGDDIDIELNEVSTKRFVERYDNLGNVQDSAVDDSTAAVGSEFPQKRQKEQGKPTSQGQLYDKNARSRSRGKNKSNRWRRPSQHSENQTARRPPQQSYSIFPQGFSQFEYGQNINFSSTIRQRQTPGAGFGSSQNHVWPQSRRHHHTPPSRFSNNMFITPETQQDTTHASFYNDPGLSAHFLPQPKTRHLLYKNPHHHSQAYHPQPSHPPYPGINPSQMPMQASFGNNQYLTDFQYNGANSHAGNSFIYASAGSSTDGADPTFPHMSYPGAHVGNSFPGSVPSESYFPHNNQNNRLT